MTELSDFLPTPSTFCMEKFWVYPYVDMLHSNILTYGQLKGMKLLMNWKLYKVTNTTITIIFNTFSWNS